MRTQPGANRRMPRARGRPNATSPHSNVKREHDRTRACLPNSAPLCRQMDGATSSIRWRQYLELPVNTVLSGSPFTLERAGRLVKSNNILEVSLGSTDFLVFECCTMHWLRDNQSSACPCTHISVKRVAHLPGCDESRTAKSKRRLPHLASGSSDP